jgi:hypothetical protein
VKLGSGWLERLIRKALRAEKVTAAEVSVLLCDDRRIRAIRLFQDMSGWTPHYVEGGVHAAYEPLCLGPAWVSGSGKDAT